MGRARMRRQLGTAALVAAAAAVVLLAHADADTVPMARFMYKFSFKPPALADGGPVPFWEHSGSTIISPDRVRLTPSIRSKSGRIFSKNPNTMNEWEIVLKLSIAGRSKIGGDGMAFWYTKQRMEEGNVYGSRDRWEGLGIFFDTYDNDAKRNNPTIMGMLNDGTRSYSHETDAADQVFDTCTSFFRNTVRPPIFKITYLQQRLAVLADVTGDGDKFTECFAQADVVLPTGYYFGMSAATGGLADDHDVLSFEAFWLNPDPMREPSAGDARGDAAGEANAAAAEHEYEQRMADFEKKREEYLQSHPNEREEQTTAEEPVALHQLVEQLNQVRESIQQDIQELGRELSETRGANAGGQANEPLQASLQTLHGQLQVATSEIGALRSEMESTRQQAVLNRGRAPPGPGAASLDGLEVLRSQVADLARSVESIQRLLDRQGETQQVLVRNLKADMRQILSALDAPGGRGGGGRAAAFAASAFDDWALVAAGVGLLAAAAVALVVYRGRKQSDKPHYF